ncbi:hypothetical protein B5S33_g3104 [[Candida] boidinii]|nr:hypothetical protein B5S30_g897 [[Candida] boidinii]OWB84458.1 hypothetical protein B5S33_g3104 [[Candida] boidinii]
MSASIPTEHKAAVFSGETEDKKLIKIVSTPTVSPGKGQLLIKSEAAALNPTDWKHIVHGWGGAGDVVGSDVAGVVVAVGEGVEGFEIGDHVSAFAHGGYTPRPTEGVFQEYAVIYVDFTIKHKHLTKATKSESPIGDIETFEDAASINLGLITVGMSFYHFFKLRFNTEEQKGKAILIWGGATATGALAIQVAKILGLEVITVASKKHEANLKTLGASAVFDYHDSNVVEQIKKYGVDRIVYGLDTIASETSFNGTYDALSDNKPSTIDNLFFLKKSAINNVKPTDNVTFAEGTTAKGLAYFVLGEDSTSAKGTIVFKSSASIKKDHLEFLKEIRKLIYNKQIKHIPITVLPNGLESVEEGLSLLRNDKVSFNKLTIAL